MNLNIKTTLNMKITSIKGNQAKSTKPNLQNHVYQQNKTYQIKPSKATKAKPKIQFIIQISKFKIC